MHNCLPHSPHPKDFQPPPPTQLGERPTVAAYGSQGGWLKALGLGSCFWLAALDTPSGSQLILVRNSPRDWVSEGHTATPTHQDTP